jgi:hypothetical protein
MEAVLPYMVVLKISSSLSPAGAAGCRRRTAGSRGRWANGRGGVILPHLALFCPAFAAGRVGARGVRGGGPGKVVGPPVVVAASVSAAGVDHAGAGRSVRLVRHVDRLPRPLVWRVHRSRQQLRSFSSHQPERSGPRRVFNDSMHYARVRLPRGRLPCYR